MRPTFSVFCFLFCFAFAFSQHKYDIDVAWDGTSEHLQITQDVTWTNSSDVAVDKITLLDWNHAYSSEHSPLGKFLAREYDYKLIRTKKKKRGFTTITTIRNQNDTLDWKRLPSAIDIIEVSLPKPVAPMAQFSFTIRYNVQLPNADIFKYGAAKNELHAQHWYLVLAKQKKGGTWIHDSNLGFGKPLSPIAKTTFKIRVPKNVNAVLPTSKSESYTPLLFTTNDDYMRVVFGESELISDMLPTESSSDFDKKFNRILAFVEDVFPNKLPNVLWALQKDYAQSPLLALESLPQFLNAFDKNQVIELKLLKIILEQSVAYQFGFQKKNTTWITDGLPFYLWQQYVSINYPDLKMTGSLNTWPFIKNYHFTQAPYYRSWEIAANISANKNRGQALYTPKDQLTRYNRRVANPYRAGLALRYLDAYLGNNTLLNALKTMPKTTRLARILHDELAQRTDKPLDWFFDHYISQNNNGDISISSKRLEKETYELTVASSQRNTVVPLSITTQNGEHNTRWLTKNDLPYIEIFDKKTTKELIVNKNHLIPELSSNNNSYNLNKRFFRNNLRLRLFQDIPQSGTSVLLITPEFGYNVYDGLLAGLSLGNSSMLNNNFKFKFSPQYGTKSGQVNGLGYLIGDIYHENKSHYLTRATLFGSSYNYAANKRYSTFSPSLQFYFRPNGIQQKDRSYLLFRHISVRLDDLPEDDNRRNYGVSLASFQTKSGDAIQNLSTKTELQWAKSFKKLSLETEYIYYYLPNRRFTFRAFAGGFFHNSSDDSYFDYNSSRVNDYLFQYDLYGRSETEGFFSQQYIKAEGALRTTGTITSANKWLITSQTSTTLWRWIEGYAEVGWIKNSKQKTHTHWGTGVSFNLIPDFFEVHFPLYDATGNLMTKEAYPTQIRFQLSLRPATLVQLFSRSWF